MTDAYIFETNNLNIVDYGFASPYVDEKTKRHIAKGEVAEFRGNIVFSSLNQLKFQETSRRDDIISLFYLLIDLLHDCKMPGIPYDSE